MSVPPYEKDPTEIYRLSFATIRKEIDLSRFPKGLDELVIRLIHACGMVDLADDVVFSDDAWSQGQMALRQGADVICDVEMVRHGIIERLLPCDNNVRCFLNELDVPRLATDMQTTRSAAQVELWRPHLKGSIIAIGNAPTALFRLLELIDEGGDMPALILGLPVGFVGAEESKAELIANARGCPFISVSGRRGGSAMASAAVNALAGGLENHG